MFLHQIDLTTALRPSLLPDETLLFVQDGVGLYEGKFKIPNYQNGHVYLTSLRACYVDNENPRKYCAAVDLKDVDRSEIYARFLKSSPKVILIPIVKMRLSGASVGPSPSIPGPSRQDPSTRTHAPSPVPRSNATWVCPICSFANVLPPNFDPATANSRTVLAPCQACGIKPPLLHVVKAALAATKSSSAPISNQPSVGPSKHAASSQSTNFECPRCTYKNHPSLLECELCGASLVSAVDPRLGVGRDIQRAESPGPTLMNLSINNNPEESVKFSFRAGGEKIFYERLKGAMVQRKWLLQTAPAIPSSAESTNTASTDSQNPEARKLVGIAGLERRGQDLRKANERIIGDAFEDLEALMVSAKDIIALAESFSSQANETSGLSAEADSVLSQSATTLGLATTKDMLGSDTLYISELSRNLAEYLTDDTKGILKKEGGIVSLVDLWAMFNRVRNGVELVSPADFEKAAAMWEKLKLPIRLRRFKSGVLVVQGTDRTDEKTIASIVAWLGELHNYPPSDDIPWDWYKYGRGVTAQDAAAKFGWSMGVASEELEMAEEKGALCREQGLGGILFWENWLVRMNTE